MGKLKILKNFTKTNIFSVGSNFNQKKNHPKKMSVKGYSEFYNAKRFKADNTNLNVSEDSANDELERSEVSSPVTPSFLPQMPLHSITNKLNSKSSIDFATAYSGISSAAAAHNYYSPQNYENYANFQNQHLTQQYGNQYGMAHQQYPTYQNYQNAFQTRAFINTNRSSLGNSSSSADSSSISINSPPQTNENSPVLPVANQYSNMKVNQLAENQTPLNANNRKVNLSDDSSNLSFNFGSDDGNVSSASNKKRRAVPSENKDKAYWEKRRKNNESAKRSRDIRRCKEEHISVRVIYLEQENLSLRTEIALMRAENEKLRAMMYNNTN